MKDILKCPFFLHEYAYSMLRNNKLNKAESLYQNILEAHDDFRIIGTVDIGTALYKLGYIKIKNGREDEGKALIKKYIRLRNENQNDVSYDLARCYVLLGNMDEAINHLKKAKSRDIWFHYKDPLIEEMTPPAKITDYIETKVKEHELELENARIIFRDFYEKLIAAGKAKKNRRLFVS